MKKIILILFAIFCAGKSFSQLSRYVFPQSAKWTSEKIAFSIFFTPKIDFKGTEDIRFTPRWGNEASEEYRSYTFVWFVEGAPKISGTFLQDDFTDYFNGLYRMNNKKQPVSNDISFTKPQIKKVNTAASDQETYEGKISTLDFLNGKPLALMAIIHVRNYPQANHTAILIEFSPKGYDQPVWKELNGVVDGFQLKI